MLILYGILHTEYLRLQDQKLSMIISKLTIIDRMVDANTQLSQGTRAPTLRAAIDFCETE